MDHFAYKDGILHAEDVSIPTLAQQVGTPFYIYSTATLQRHFQVFSEGLAEVNPLVCFAVKCNSNRAVLATLAAEGAGADVVSEGEIRLAIAAGISPKKMVFSGVGKTKSEMAYALDQDIFQFNVESEPELDALSEVASSKGAEAAIAIRINPDVDPQTHAKISTGQKESKFGVNMPQVLPLYTKAAALPGIKVQGVSMHIGSQLTSLEPFRMAYRRAASLVQELRAAGHSIDTLDLGGGLGIPYDDDNTPPDPTSYGAMVAETVGDIGCQLIFEPGRLIAGNAGILVSEVIYVKQGEVRVHLIVDAAMNDLLRPAMYDAHHGIVPVRENSEMMIADVVGPVCETGDIFAAGREVAKVASGDLVAFRSAGAYGAVMSGTYNSRHLIPEVMVNGDQFAVIRTRPDYDALLASHVMPEWLDSE